MIKNFLKENKLMAYEKWKDKRKNSAFAQLSGGKREDVGKNLGIREPPKSGI